VEIYSSAPKHDIADEDIAYAIEHALVLGEIEAEAGLDVTQLRRRPGRPAMGSGPADPFPVRLDPELRAALDERAASDDTTASDVIREALRRYLKVS